MYVQLFLKLVLLYRLEKKISSVEKKKSVKWNFDDPSLIEALSSANKKKETKIIQSIKQILGEKNTCFDLSRNMLVRHIYPVCVCVCLYI